MNTDKRNGGVPCFPLYLPLVPPLSMTVIILTGTNNKKVAYASCFFCFPAKCSPKAKDDLHNWNEVCWKGNLCQIEE